MQKRLAAAALMLALAAGRAAAQTAAREPAIIPPEDSVARNAQGTNVVRVEKEMTILVPEDQVEAMREHLKAKYVGRLAFLDRYGHQMRSRTSDEYFYDRYFDTPDLVMLRDSSGIRIRSRSIPGDTANRKDGRELVQMKLRRVGDSRMARSEIKFDVDRSGGPGWEGTHPLVGVIVEEQRPLFLKRMEEFAIEPRTMKEIVALNQRRWRVYVDDQSGAFVTITLDQTNTGRWGASAKWTQVEIELNEIRFTSGTREERRVMETLIPDIWADLQRAIPGLEQDQTPKVVQAVEKLSADSWTFPMMLRLHLHQEQSVVLASAVLVVGVGAGASVRGRRSRRRTG